MVPPRVPLECYFNSVNEYLGRLIAVAVAVNRETGLVIGADYVGHLFGWN